TFIFLCILICLSAFFSASEMALSSVNKVRIKTMADDGDKRAAKVLALTERFDRTLSVILIGNNIVNIALSSILTVFATNLFGAGGVAIATAVATVLILIFGEITPKCVAKEKAEDTALSISPVLSLIIMILYPVAVLFVKLQGLISKMAGAEKAQPYVTEQELLNIIETIEEEGVIDEQRSELMQSALAFDETVAQDVLTPRVDLTAINVSDSPEKIKELVLTERFSRIPVFEKTLDNIIGILHTRDYLEALLKEGQAPADIRPLLTKPVFVHKTQRVAALLNDFRKKRVHMAVVTDDFGGTMGIVSMEDVLEELVGEIWDEDEEAEIDFVQTEQFVYRVSGDFPVEEALEKIGYELKNFESEFASVGGWALEQLGHIPTAGESFEADGISVTIDEMEEQRIVKLTLRYVPPAPEE
ncbi:MAG: HlyC/CorC family transporter, partial [Oscillospiraceae bacterium]|nr:HlyC/CorC family transporter [Oscillospiraceae bacterium]